ncbi:DNA-binding transcriptional regulator of glucitol operon [Paraburkholderia bannensis]|jgi:hypothetical protein|uniref:DNA-binding transcriptional regulator of glucitol operon n=1 Tax=Paraburkholderia bannensis TaxID=765414 RepID=A0A7W9U252_9BURK|nr:MULTISPECIES: hypothetical protein [Paraburkholderia]MBB3259539.1 DNA-binding transcriptional regulator of glucitol operon [Paraburkholderia sp. WP4_3_2]MBB6104555.1 DNA-binding transcriptional regulator of glucitol operon [Paraburkholderia bannensis]
MKKVSLAVLISLSALTGAAYAQSDNGIMMSTDPAKAADVEQRAQDLQARQQAMPQPSEAPMKHHKKGGHPHHKAPPKSEQ